MTSKNLFKFFFVLLISALGNAGCTMMQTVESTRIPQNEIRQTFQIAADRTGTRVTAVFNHGRRGKSIDLDAPSRIEYNGHEMAEIAPNLLKGTTYEAGAERFQNRHQFVYTNGDGAVFRNAASFEAAEIAGSEIAVSRTRETAVRLSRRIAENENITISLESIENPPESEITELDSAANKKTDAPVYNQLLSGELDETRAAVILKPKDFKNFAAGRAVLKINVGREISLQEKTDAGGTIRWTYTSTASAVVTN